GFLQLQTIEKDFFLNKWEDRVLAHAEKTAEVKARIAEVEAVIARNPHRRLPAEGQLTAAFDAYESGFAQAVETSKRLGLSADQGLQKGLRSATNYLADQLAKVPFAQLKVDAADIFTREKEFVMTPTNDNRARVKEAIDE